MTSQGAVAVIGGGPAGLAAAISLANAGRRTRLIERGEALGGRAEVLACKANDRCQVCGACVAAGLHRDVLSHPLIEICTEARIDRCERSAGGFLLTYASPDGDQQAEVSGIVLATGYRTIDFALDRQEFGHGIVDGVTATLELEQLFRDQGPSGVPARKFAFIQCVGSRDKSLSHDYCSRICCASSLRLARLIRAEIEDSEVTVYYQDLQPSGRRFEALLAECQERGVRLVRGLPSKVRRSLRGSKPVVCVADTLTGKPEETVYDCVVLAVGMWPQTPDDICPGLEIALDDDGFCAAVQSPDLQVAGAALGPMGIVEALDSGRVAAASLLVSLGVSPAELQESAGPLARAVLLTSPEPLQPLPAEAPGVAQTTADVDVNRCTGDVVFVMDLGQRRNREAHIRAMQAASELGPRATFVYSNAYTAEPGLERLYAAMRDSGVALYAYSQPPTLTEGKARLVDPLLPGGEPVELACDVLVIGEDLLPNEQTPAWAEAHGLQMGNDGYVAHDNPHLGVTRTERRGVFVVDSARGVLSSAGLALSASAIARALALVDAQDGLAEVDSAKCTTCLTCLRVCPHSAPELVWDDDRARDVSSIAPAACMSCGICVAACPADAISLATPGTETRIPGEGVQV